MPPESQAPNPLGGIGLHNNWSGKTRKLVQLKQYACHGLGLLASISWKGFGLWLQSRKVLDVTFARTGRTGDGLQRFRKKL